MLDTKLMKIYINTKIIAKLLSMKCNFYVAKRYTNTDREERTYIHTFPILPSKMQEIA